MVSDSLYYIQLLLFLIQKLKIFSPLSTTKLLVSQHSIKTVTSCMSLHTHVSPSLLPYHAHTCTHTHTHTHTHTLTLTLTHSTGEDDWNIVFVECGSLAAKWEQLSACLGLAKANIDSIRESRSRDSAGCWSEALSQWIKQNYSTQRFGLPSWRSLLKSVAVVDKQLVKELATKHPSGIHVTSVNSNMLGLGQSLFINCKNYMCSEVP